MTSHPLNCYSGLSTDDFAGWYAVQDTTKCNDFCFWKQPDEYHEQQQNTIHKLEGFIYSSEVNEAETKTKADSTKLPHSTTDPHQSTITDTNAKWVCLLNGASDDTMLDTIFETTKNDKKNLKIFHDEKIFKFDSLKCSRGAGEIIQSNGQVILSSITFWSVVMIICIIVYVIQIVYVILWRRKRRRMDVMDDVVRNNELQLDIMMNVEESQENMQDGSSTKEGGEKQHTVKEGYASSKEVNSTNNLGPEQEQVSKWRSISKVLCSKRACLLPTIVLLDMFLLYTLFTAILVISEIDQKLNLPHSLQMLTPPCSNTKLLCPDANIPIDKPSKAHHVNKEGSNTFQPFSYMIASDSQLDWYNGESAYIGKLNYPPPCSSRDSCGSCTKKLGLYTNQQLKKSFEQLIQKRRRGVTAGGDGEDDEVVQTKNIMLNNYTHNDEYPIPKALIMNGDLTQYFHRHERKKYESIYHNIQGLDEYFPGLGNHDYDQYNGATYNNDEWVGPHYCNGKHAISYFKGAFCNKIPKFDAKSRLTRYDPKSLSYSWEEGPYHFIQVHYYPTFENAGLGISSSIEWLTRDLQLANEQNLTSVLFVHASSGLPSILEDTLLNSNVAVIFTGHLHRCLGQKCELVTGMNSFQAEKFFNSTRDNTTSGYEGVETCFPSSAILCSKNANGNGLFYVKDMNEDLIIPDRKLFSKVPIQRGLCPVSKYGPYLNETENTALCRRRTITPHFPREPRTDNRSIPIFWSGSASFESFLVADFYHNRIVVNVMTGKERSEGQRYVDVHKVPNAIYPFHQTSDLNEKTIFITN